MTVALRRGRPKGSPNKTTTEVARMCRRIVEDPEYLESLRVRALENKLGPMEPLLWHYAHGKPKDRVQVEQLPPLLVVNKLE
jgi:hypothetical protein